MSPPSPRRLTRHSFCAHLAAVEMNIEASMAPSFAKELAIAAIYGTKKAAGCLID